MLYYKSIIGSFAFGFTIAIVIGPIAIIIIQKAMTAGLKASLLSSLGAALADGLYAITAFLASFSIIEFLTNHKTVVATVSSGILILFGIYILIEAFKKNKKSDFQEAQRITQSKHHLLSVFLLTASNPLTIVLFAGFAGQTVKDISFLEVLIYSFALFLGSLMAQCCLSFAGYWFHQFTQRWNTVHYFNILSGCIITGFGVAQLLK